MNTLISNQYGRVQGEVGGCGLTLCVTAQTPRRESVELQTRVDSIEQQLHLLAILSAVERRIEQFQLRDSKASESAEQQSPFDGIICGEEDLFRSNPRNLKLVMLFDPRDESYSICSHNLRAEGARQKLDELRDEGLFAFTVGQPSHHPPDDPDDCTACRAELAWLLAESR